MGRKIARETIMNSLYQMDMNNDFSMDSIKGYIESNLASKKDVEFALEVCNLVVENKEEIDGKIESHLKDWTLDRLSKVDLAILRLAVAEILYVEDITINITANEAVNLAKKFSGEQSAKFINGVIGNI